MILCHCLCDRYLLAVTRHEDRLAGRAMTKKSESRGRGIGFRFPMGVSNTMPSSWKRDLKHFRPHYWLVSQKIWQSRNMFIHIFHKELRCSQRNEKSVQQLSQCRFHTRPVVRVSHSNEKWIIHKLWRNHLSLLRIGLAIGVTCPCRRAISSAIWCSG